MNPEVVAAAMRILQSTNPDSAVTYRHIAQRAGEVMMSVPADQTVTYSYGPATIGGIGEAARGRERRRRIRKKKGPGHSASATSRARMSGAMHEYFKLRPRRKVARGRSAGRAASATTGTARKKKKGHSAARKKKKKGGRKKKGRSAPRRGRAKKGKRSGTSTLSILKKLLAK